MPSKSWIRILASIALFFSGFFLSWYAVIQLFRDSIFSTVLSVTGAGLLILASTEIGSTSRRSPLPNKSGILTATRDFASITLFIAGYLASSWAGFCLLGGPDARFLSADSFRYGVPYLIVAILLIFASTKLVPAKAYVFAPILAAIVAWLLALTPFRYVSFDLWLFGTPAVFAASLAYWIVSRILAAEA